MLEMAAYVPVVLTVDEVSRVLAHLNGDKWLIVMLLYGGVLFSSLSSANR